MRASGWRRGRGGFLGLGVWLDRERFFPDIERLFVQQLQLFLDMTRFDLYSANHKSNVAKLKEKIDEIFSLTGNGDDVDGRADFRGATDGVGFR
jgi:hypothetical protein